MTYRPTDAEISRATDNRNAELLSEYIKEAVKDKEILAKVVDDYLATGPSQTFMEAIAALCVADNMASGLFASAGIQKAILTHLGEWAKDEAPSISEDQMYLEMTGAPRED